MSYETVAMVAFCSGFALFLFLVGYIVGREDGKSKGRIAETEDRISRTIIDQVRKENCISTLYSKDDINRAIEYGKKQDFFFSVEEVKPLRVIIGKKE